jgi:hypothetical protein
MQIPKHLKTDAALLKALEEAAKVKLTSEEIEQQRAHQADVSQIGQPPKFGPVVRISANQSYRKMPSFIPGLTYTKTQISAFKYFTLTHDSSGKRLATFTSGPVDARDKDFMSHIDAVVRPFAIDWTKSEDELAKDLTPEKMMQLRSAISSATTKGDDQWIRIRK